MARLIYSSGAGPICPRCGAGEAECRCNSADDEPVPRKIVAKLRVERTGRAGKTVTVVDGLPRNEAFLQTLSRALKRACGVGGGIGEGRVELQGDVRDRVRELMIQQGYIVKG